MGSDDSSILQAIDVATLRTFARQAVRRANLQITDWHTSQLAGGAGNPVSVGLYRFAGTGHDRDEHMAWSVILKIIQSPANVGGVNIGEGDDQAHWNYWKRELLVYQSDLLETLPEGLAAPRCYDAVELSGHIAWLWLEDIANSAEEVWTLERYALAARHLGRLNGSYAAARPLPAFPWLGNHLIRQWITSTPWRDIPWEHPRLLVRYPRPEVNSFRRLLLESDRFLAKLDLLPRTICHGDTYPTNFKSRRLSDGQEQTVALDWALTGIAPLGDDLGQLVFGAHLNLKEVQRAEVDAALFESYLAGLHESDCRVDPRLVRFGYTVSAALRVGMFQLYLLNEELKRSDAVAEPAVEHAIVPVCFEVAMADEAIKLLTEI